MIARLGRLLRLVLDMSDEWLDEPCTAAGIHALADAGLADRETALAACAKGRQRSDGQSSPIKVCSTAVWRCCRRRPSILSLLTGMRWESLDKAVFSP